MSRHAHCPRALASLAKLFAAVALFLIPFGSAFAQTQSYPYRPGEVLIKFLPGTSAAEQSAILGDLGATRLANLRQIGATQERISRLSVDEAIARYRGDRRVQYIEPNYVVHAFVTPNDPLFGQLWGMHNTGQTGGVVGADIHATQAWDVSTGSSNVLVAIIDTGVDYTHPDLAGNIFTNTAEIPGNGIDDDGNGFVDDVHGWDFVNHDNDPMDDFGHGTHVSGTVAAIGNNALGVVGVSWSAKILPLKFLDASGSGSTADAISAIQYATMMGVRIMSNSWGGGGYSQALHDAIQAAGDAGIVFVAAAGNSSSNNDVSPAYPASYDLPNIISVAASDPNDNLAYFSNFGATTVDLAAPGTDILSTFPGGGYQYESGTSMATPHVSGALALIMGHFPMIDGLSAKNLLLANVDPESAFAGKTLTGGRLNAFKPLLVADSIPPGPIADVSVMQTGGDWVNLQWTATGDDGAIGRAVRYDMRYSTAPINAANFAAATAAGGAPDPQTAGATEHVRVNGLGFSTFYYFAVKAFDELGNPSPMSNVVSATTLGAPVAGASPESLSADLLTGGKVTRTLTISNSGASELRFDIGQEAPAAPLTLPASVMAAIGKSTLRAPRLGGGTLASGARYEAGHSPTRLPVANPVRPPLNAAAGIGLNVLLLESGADVSQMHDLLAAFPDIAKVDIFDATSAVPTADLLRGYNSVIAVDATAFGDPVGVGNALADYVDGGGGLVMTLASFINGWAINGRLLTGGYIPFELGSGPVGSSTLGTFDASHPIMKGVTTISGDVLGEVSLASDAKLVASWTGGLPFVATRGDRVAAVNIFFGASGYWTGDVPLLIHNAAFWAGGAGRFLSTAPDSGVIPAGSSAQVQVTFDATGQNGGDYRLNVRVHSNDPVTPKILIPAHLHVTGAPDILVVPDSLEYGQLFIGAAKTESVVVTNRGTDLLSISGVTVTPPQYTAPLAGFNLAPGQSRSLQVTFAPTTAAVIAGTLQIASNDPDQPLVSVALHGEGLVAPDIAVSPDSFTVALLTGQSAQRTLVIQNTGGSNLLFSIGTRSTATPAPQAATMQRGKPMSGSVPKVWAGGSVSTVGGTPKPVRGGPGTLGAVRNSVQAGNDVLVLTTTQVDSSLGRALLELGHGYDIIFTQDFTGIDFTPYKTIVVGMDGGGIETPSCQALANAAAGGRLLMMFGGTSYTPYYNGLQTYLLSNTGEQGWQQSLPPHFTVVNPADPLAIGLPASTNFSDANASYYMLRINDPAAPVAAKNGDNHPILVHKPIGSGMLVYFTNSPFQYYWSVASDYAILRQIIQNAFTLAPAHWLTASPDSGVVAPGQQVSVQVGFNALGLNGGDYRADLLIANNVPNKSPYTVPAHLHVTGAPDILVVPDSLEYGQLFIGAAKTESVVVTNRGTDLLSISGVTVTPPQYTAPLAGFNLAPGQSRSLQVTFAPTAPAVFAGTLQIASNDPDQPLVSVTLHGEGLVAPDIAVSPDSFTVALLTGQSAQRTLVIQNTGGSNLLFSIGARGTATSTPQAAALPVGTLASAARAGLPALAARSGALPDVAPSAAFSAFGGKLSSMSAPKVWLGGSMAQVGMTPGMGRGKSAPLGAGRNSVQAGNDILVLATVSVDSSLGRALLELGHSYDIIYTPDFTGIDFTPYHTIIVAMVGGAVEIPSCQALANAAAGGRLVLMLGGTDYGPFYAGVQSSLLSLTGEMGWTIPLSPHLTVVNASDPLAAGLPPSTTFVNSSAAYYMLRINDPAAVVVAKNGDNHPALVRKTIGAGTLISFIDAVYDGFWNYPADYVILKQVVKNALAFSSVSWLSATPDSGVVTPGNQVSVQIGFDASGLNGGDYRANVEISSNDPDESPYDVPVHLHVTGAPVISAIPDTLSFGSLFIGAAKSESVLVKNMGSDVLNVSSVSVSPAAFTAATGPFSLAPGQSHALYVTFAPTTAVSYSGSLSLQSNDSVHPTLSVALFGTGLIPPAIAVAPLSLNVSLLAAGHVSKPIDISNTGGSDLSFSVFIASGPAPQTAARPAPGDGTNTSHARRAGATTARGDGTGLVAPSGPSGLYPALAHQLSLISPQAIAFHDDMEHGDNGWTKQVYGVDDLWHRTTRASNSPVTSWWCGLESSGDYSTGNRISTAAVSPLIDLRFLQAPVTLQFSENYQTEPSFDFCMVDVQPETSATWTPLRGGLGSAPSGSSFGWRVTTLDLSPWAGQRVRIRFYFDTIDPIANNYPGWFFDDVLVTATGVSWLNVTPDAGVVAASGKQTVQANFDAAGLIGGDYSAQIRISSNDPAQPTVTVPAQLHVTGAADIVATPTAIDFGMIFVGATVQDTLLITSDGTDSLKVSSIDVVNTAFSAPSAGFTLPVGGTRKIVVTYHPTAIGNSIGTLTIHNNDPDNGTLAIPLSGQAAEAPSASLMPSLLRVSMLPDDARTVNMRLDNLGGSTLNWFIDIGSSVSTQVVAHETGLDSLGIIAFLQAGGRAGAVAAAVASPAVNASRPAAMKAGAAGLRSLTRPGARLDADQVSSLPVIGDVLTQLDSRYSAITAAIPNRYDFTEGVAGTSILDGGQNMYDTGNILGTNIGFPISYSDGVISYSPKFNGNYFTRKYPGLFVLTADISGVPTFSITGDLGADGSGSVDGTVLSAIFGGVTYRGYVKRVYGAGVPSVNHLIILPNPGQSSHGFALSTNNDFDSVSGLATLGRFYYLLFAGNNGSYISDADMMQIMQQFLVAASPSPLWVSAIPSSGSLQGHDHLTVGAHFDSHGLAFGDYNAEMFLHSNDPIQPTITVPITLSVVENPTATDAALVSSSVTPGKVELVWYAANAASLNASVYRQTAGQDWALLAPVTGDGEGYLKYEDDNVVAGASYGYRLGITQDGALRFAGETHVDVPKSARFELAGMQPNPAVHDLNVAFSLPDAEPATLELLDLAGRRLRSQQIGNQGAGRHVVSLGQVGSLPSGVYMVRIQRGDRSLIAKCVIMQ